MRPPPALQRLGLSIAKSLTETHKGVIAVTGNGENGGATLSVELATIPAATSLPPAVVSSPKAIKGRILLVEDHADTRRIMSRLLRSFGCAVSTAGSVKEAMEVAARETFDLLVSDIGLPDGSGTDIMREFKSRYPTRGIALSGFGQEEDVQRILDAGFAMHLIKPVNFQTLQDVIRKMVG